MALAGVLQAIPDEPGNVVVVIFAAFSNMHPQFEQPE